MHETLSPASSLDTKPAGWRHSRALLTTALVLVSVQLFWLAVERTQAGLFLFFLVPDPFGWQRWAIRTTTVLVALTAAGAVSLYRPAPRFARIAALANGLWVFSLWLYPNWLYSIVFTLDPAGHRSDFVGAAFTLPVVLLGSVALIAIAIVWGRSSGFASQHALAAGSSQRRHARVLLVIPAVLTIVEIVFAAIQSMAPPPSVAGQLWFALFTVSAWCITPIAVIQVFSAWRYRPPNLLLRAMTTLTAVFVIPFVLIIHLFSPFGPARPFGLNTLVLCGALLGIPAMACTVAELAVLGVTLGRHERPSP